VNSSRATRAQTITIKFAPRKSGNGGTWYLYCRPALPDGTTLIPVKGCTTREDRPKVEAEAQRFRDALANIRATPKAETCDGFFARYVSYQKELGSTDADKKATRWKKWISPRIGHKRPADVGRSDIEDVRDALDVAIREWAPGKAAKNGTCLSGKTGMNVWTALTSTFKAATSSKRRDLRVLDGKPNPCVGVEPPGDRESRRARRKTFLYPKEAAALLSCDGLEGVPRDWREVYAVAFYTYLRPGELRVLTWGDVDFDAGHISITKAWDYADAKIKTPKTANGVRRVPLEASLRPLLERMAKGREASDLVVPTLSAFGEDHLAQLFREHLTRAGVKRAELHTSTRTHVQGNFRSCRDSGITYLAMSGLGVDKIVRRAGHDDVQTSMGYVKLAEDLSGSLGVPFAPLPASLVTREVSVTCEAPDPLTVQNDSRILDVIVPEEGVEPKTKAHEVPIFTGDRAPNSHPVERVKPTRDDVPRGTSLATLAAKARLLERLLVGDERVLATELRGELEALVGPLAEIVPFRHRR
jgi:integrase